MYVVTVLFCVVGSAYCVNLVGRKAGAGSKAHFTAVLATMFLMVCLIGFSHGVLFGAVIGLASGVVLATAKFAIGAIFSFFAFLGKKGLLGKDEVSAQ